MIGTAIDTNLMNKSLYSIFYQLDDNKDILLLQILHHFYSK